MLVKYDEYKAVYGADISREDYSRISFDAEALCDDLTTGADGFRKLRAAFPTDETDAAKVKRGIMAVIRGLRDIEKAEALTGVTESGGVARAGIATAMNSGAESVTFGGYSASVKAAQSPAERRSYLRSRAEEYFRGCKDKNGVNLLFMGVYPYVR